MPLLSATGENSNPNTKRRVGRKGDGHAHHVNLLHPGAGRPPPVMAGLLGLGVGEVPPGGKAEPMEEEEVGRP